MAARQHLFSMAGCSGNIQRFSDNGGVVGSNLLYGSSNISNSGSAKHLTAAGSMWRGSERSSARLCAHLINMSNVALGGSNSYNSMADARGSGAGFNIGASDNNARVARQWQIMA